MAQAGRPRFEENPEKPLRGPATHTKTLRLFLLKRSGRREGSLAAALVQSMALAVISTAGAYPSWVLVTSSKRQVVLGASWAINQADPPPHSPLLGRMGGALMMAIAFCCLLSVLTASSAIGWDFLGRQQCRRLGPMLHGLTALLITCSAALGSSLLVQVRGRTRIVPELQPLKFTASPGQSLFLSFLACALASTATGLSCSSPALVATARSSRDVGRPSTRRFSSHTDSDESPDVSPYDSWRDGKFFDPLDPETSSSPDDEERSGPLEWYNYLKRELAQAAWQERWWKRQPPPQQQQQEEHCVSQRQEPAAQVGERAITEKHWDSKPLPQWGIQRELARPQFMEDAVHTRQHGNKETDQEDPGRGDAELQLSLAPESQRVKNDEERPGPLEWYNYLKRELAQAAWQERWWKRQPTPQQQEEHYAIAQWYGPSSQISS
ncbi:UNVERIFIED_CONTAM: hypothetical protein K2H54_058263 [Gekko kuhli]